MNPYSQQLAAHAPKKEALVAVGSTDLFAALKARLEHAEQRYNQELAEGDAISIASTRASFLAFQDAIYLFRRYSTANAD